MRLGSPERGIGARLVHRAVDERRRGAGGREGAPRGRCEAVGGGLVEAAFEREDVPLEPGEQVQAGTETGVRQLGQVRMQIDHPREQDPRSEVEGRGRVLGPLPGRPREHDPTGTVHDHQPVRLVARAAIVERGQDPSADRERRADRQTHGRQASRRHRDGAGHGTTRIGRGSGS